MGSIKIRWVLAHEPIELFIRAGLSFAENVRKATQGAVEVEVMTVSEYSKKYNSGIPVSRHSLLDLMDQGRIEMSQMYTTSLSKFHHDMSVLDLPFLFENHEHASRVLDGSIGKSLFAGLAEKTSIQGLAFTYSGGYRMITAKNPINSIEDFKGLKIRTAHSAVAEATFAAVGAQAIPMDLEDLNEAMDDGHLNGGESTYPRFFSMKQNEVSTVVNDTQHSLFLTSILANSKFWNSLDANLRQILAEAARKAAVVERKESIDDIVEIQNKCREMNIDIVTLSDNEKTRFKKATEMVYEKFEPTFTNSLVRRIKES